MENLPKPFEQEWNLEFHGVSYIVNMTVTEVLLTLELENADTTERWSAQFTAQAVEEFTHKAGNIKKLSVFSKMLASSFSKDNESLHVDILTYTDLALLKAARKGNNTSSNDIKPNSSMTQSKQNPEQWQKRYIILTYRGEFNHNHYPLPLDFEDKPNFPALKRTIARLRKYILNKENEEKEPATAKERELREMVSKLRQDNTELRHRLRHSSANNLNTSTTNASMISGAANIHALNSEISNTNVKLRKQIEVLKKELQDISQSYEQLRTESAREIARWKLKITGNTSSNTASPSNYSIGSDHSHSSNNNMRSQSILIAELRQKNTALEKELRYERLHRGANATPTRGWSSSTNTHSRSGIADRYNTTRSMSADTMRRSTSATTRSGATRQGWNTSTTERERNPSRGSTNSRTGSRTTSRSTTPTTMTRRSSSPVVGPNTTNTTRYRTREASPPLRPRGAGRTPDSQYPTPTSGRRSSPALSTSLGGRFDPTAYQQDRAQRLQQAKNSRAWGAGSGSSPARYRSHSPGPGDSGYSSANSQSSRGSRLSQRSQRSQRSEVSQGMSSTASKNSQTRKKTTKKKNTTTASASTKRGTSTEKGHYTNKTTSVHVLSNEISTTTATTTAATGNRVGDRSTWGAGHRATKKSSEIGRVNSKYHPTDNIEDHTQLSVVAKHLHRRSRESPDGDSETDDSEFLPPAVNKSLERARQAVGLQPPHRPPPSTTSEGIPITEEEETAYNTYVNVISNSKLAHTQQDQDSRRNSHERLVAVAKERSSYLDHDHEDDMSRDVQEAVLRRSGNSSLRSSSELPLSLQSESRQSHHHQQQSQQQLRGSRDSVASLGKDLRSSLDSAKSMASLSKALSSSPHMSRKTRPAGAAAVGGSGLGEARRSGDSSTGLSELRNSIGSLRASRDRSSDLHPTTTSTTSTFLDESLPTEELSAMDKRIKALQAYLDNAKFT